MNLTTPQTLAISSCADLQMSTNYLIAREPRKIHFIDPDKHQIVSTIDLAVDNDFGYKRIVVRQDVCYTVVHGTFDSTNPIFGKGAEAHLNAYDRSGLLWSQPLPGWTTGGNYGGLHLLGDSLVVVVAPSDEHCECVVLNPETGELVSRMPIDKIVHTGNNVVNSTTALVQDETLWLGAQAVGLLALNLPAGEPSITSVSDLKVKLITRNQNFTYVVGALKEQPSLQTFDTSLNKVQELSLDVAASTALEDVYATMHDELIILLHKDYSIHAFNLSNQQVQWTLAGDKAEEVYQVKVLDENHLAVLFVEPAPCIKVLDIQSGEVIQSLENDNFMEPFFVLNNQLFCNGFFDLFGYKIEP